MINKRLISLVPESKIYIFANVLFQWLALTANTVMMICIANLFGSLFSDTYADVQIYIVVCIFGVCIRYACQYLAVKMSFLASCQVKQTLREKIYRKLLSLGPSYSQSTASSEIVQVTSEGVDQLETYFGAYLPQFFYSMLAPLTLFGVLVTVDWKVVVVLLVCVPLIPIAIAAVQTFAKKLLSKYWGSYTALGDTFLENLQGLTTLKIYQSDGLMHEKMNRDAEEFRRITMKVLTMQLNSITIMDIVAFTGAAVGILLGILEYQSSAVTLSGCITIILLSADFFLPMRQLGSYFHIAMNGSAAADKIFRLLDLPEKESGNAEAGDGELSVCAEDVSFSYDGETSVLQNISFRIEEPGMYAFVGTSGSGKSTLAALLSAKLPGYSGNIVLSGHEITDYADSAVLDMVTTVSTNAYLFKGTVRENLQMAADDASDDTLWDVLEKVKLAEFLKSEKGLDTKLTEGGMNFSGGQRQRLALARSLLKDTKVYIFDEATSNIDAESEDDIMHVIAALALTKPVIVISHRLYNVVSARRIYVLKDHRIAEEGTHEQLLQKHGVYDTLWKQQEALEQFSGQEADV